MNEILPQTEDLSYVDPHECVSGLPPRRAALMRHFAALDPDEVMEGEGGQESLNLELGLTTYLEGVHEGRNSHTGKPTQKRLRSLEDRRWR